MKGICHYESNQNCLKRGLVVGSKDVHTRINNDIRDHGPMTSDPFGGTANCGNVSKTRIAL